MCRFASFKVKEFIFTWLERPDSGLSGKIRFVPVDNKGNLANNCGGFVTVV